MIHLYDKITIDIDIRAQKCDLNDKKICEIYYGMICIVKSTLEDSIHQINGFLKIQKILETLKGLGSDEIKRKIFSTLLIGIPYQ